jgi:hypothetical protein
VQPNADKVRRQKRPDFRSTECTNKRPSKCPDKCPDDRSYKMSTKYPTTCPTECPIKCPTTSKQAGRQKYVFCNVTMCVLHIVGLAQNCVDQFVGFCRPASFYFVGQVVGNFVGHVIGHFVGHVVGYVVDILSDLLSGHLSGHCDGLLSGHSVDLKSGQFVGPKI